MAEYIEREKVYTLAKKVCKAVDSNPRVLLPRIILDLIDDLPAADVRPVVTCGECKYWETSWTPRGVSDGRHYCAPLDLFPSADWYCADGKKRECRCEFMLDIHAAPTIIPAEEGEA